MANPAAVINTGTSVQLPTVGSVLPVRYVGISEARGGSWLRDWTYADLLALSAQGMLQGLVWTRKDGSAQVLQLAYVGEEKGLGVFVFAGGMDEDLVLDIFKVTERDGIFYSTQSVTAPDVKRAIEELRQGLQAEAGAREHADEEIAGYLSEHMLNKVNPHEVTAGQVGAYTKAETDEAIAEALSGEIGGWLGNLTVSQVNALTTHKKGDSATMLDSGTVMPGNLAVSEGEDIMWVDSLGVWQAKASDRLHHDDGVTSLQVHGAVAYAIVIVKGNYASFKNDFDAANGFVFLNGSSYGGSAALGVWDPVASDPDSRVDELIHSGFRTTNKLLGVFTSGGDIYSIVAMKGKLSSQPALPSYIVTGMVSQPFLISNSSNNVPMPTRCLLLGAEYYGYQRTPS